MSVIEVKDLCVSFENKNCTTIALDNFSAVFCDGINVILGYSGCGKTTLMRSILGFTDFEGEIFCDGINIEKIPVKQRNFSFVSQEYGLYPQYTVFDNIAFPLKMLRVSRSEITDRVKQIAEIMGLSHCLTRKPRHISGGQQQRVAVARALVKRPAVCFMDEPFSNIDEQTGSQVREWIKSAVKRVGSTLIYVTHDFNEAMSMAERIYVMDEGKLVISGTPDEIYECDNEIVNSLKVEGFPKW